MTCGASIGQLLRHAEEKCHCMHGGHKDYSIETDAFTYHLYYIIFVKLRQGSGKDRQGMAVKAKGLKA